MQTLAPRGTTPLDFYAGFVLRAEFLGNAIAVSFEVRRGGIWVGAGFSQDRAGALAVLQPVVCARQTRAALANCATKVLSQQNQRGPPAG